MKAIKYSALAAVLAVSVPAIAQSYVDSLYNVWQDETLPDSTRVEAYRDYIWDGYLFTQPDSAFYYAQLGYDFAKSKGLKKHMASALNIQGVSFWIRGDYPNALDYYQKCLMIMEETGSKNGIANSLNNIGMIYHNQGDYFNTLNQYQRSLKIYEEIADSNGMAHSSNNIGVVYNDQGDYPNALIQYQRSLKIYEEIGDKGGIAKSLNNIGNIYLQQDDFPNALDHYQKSVKIKEELGNQQGIAVSLDNIGLIYDSQGDYSNALNYFQRSMKIGEEIGDKNGIVASLKNIGKIYNEQGDPQSAISHCIKGFLLAKEIGAISLQREVCQCLYDAYKATGNGNKALDYHEQMLLLDDSLKAEETAKKLQQMEFAKQMLADSLQQEEEKLKVELAHQQEVAKKDKTRNMLMGGGLLLLLAAVGFYSRWRYVKKSRDTISKEKDRSENLLLNILPAEIAEELKEKGEAAARDFDMVPILFTDFKGFTRASELLSAADLVAEINTCFKAFDGIVGKYNIEKIKTIGDAYMCAGGLPVPDENAAKNTVLAGLEMQAFMKARKAERDARGLPAFEMRVGIHTGPVVAGIVGVKKFQYDIWGDTVNTASRMESSGEVGQVNISEATYELVKENAEFDFTSRGKVEAKGKGVMEMYFVERL